METEEGSSMTKEEIKNEQDEKNSVPWRANLTKAKRWFAISKKGYMWDKPRCNTSNPTVFDRVWVEPTANKEYYVFEKQIRYSQWFVFLREDYDWWNTYKETEEGQIHDQYLVNLNRAHRRSQRTCRKRSRNTNTARRRSNRSTSGRRK